NVSGSVNIESDYGVNVGVVKITNYSKSKLGVVTQFSETLSTYSNYPAALSIVLTTKKGTTDQFVPISDCIKDPDELDFVIITSAEYENYKSGNRIGIRYANTEPLYIATGSSTGIIPTITPATSADDAKITWSSKNKKIVKVTSTGDTTAAFTGVKNGTTIVYATLKSTGEKIPCTVISTGIEFSISASQARGKVGKTYQLSASAEPASIFENCTISWTSSDEAIATVDSTGLITGISTGEVTITASTTALEKTYSDTCTYTVTAKDYVNVCDCGAKAGDGDDDRVAIQYAVNTFKYNKTEYEGIYIPAGEYTIDGSIRIYNDCIFYMDSEAVLCETDQAGADYNMLNIVSESFNTDGTKATEEVNIEIFGGSIIGDRKIASSGEDDGMGIHVLDCSGIYIHDIEISYMYGDGIYLGSYENGDGSTDITIENCYVHNNHRNNISLIAASDVAFTDCTIKTATGALPKASVIVENNYGEHCCENITFTNCTINNTAAGSDGYAFFSCSPYQAGSDRFSKDNPHAHGNNITFEGCSIYGSFYNYSVTNLTVSNSTIKGSYYGGSGDFKATLTNTSVSN
ncbi:MAG: Ig-like domain-containing protein, partial [Butyrivibrio sp.]|nr:Ig-like domain-containing protein [Butyrivibrio sp.]